MPKKAFLVQKVKKYKFLRRKNIFDSKLFCWFSNNSIKNIPQKLAKTSEQIKNMPKEAFLAQQVQKYIFFGVSKYFY